MLQALQVLILLLVAVAMALALAHALELPGKLRLPKDTFLAVQRIYYPGFSAGGAAEPAALVLLLAQIALMPTGTAAYRLTIAAWITLAAMHAVYWIMTHPVNNFWLGDMELSGLGSGFFRFDPLRRSGGSAPPDWTALRDRWEYSHLARAVLGLISFTLLATAATL